MKELRSCHRSERLRRCFGERRGLSKPEAQRPKRPSCGITNGRGALNMLGRGVRWGLRRRRRAGRVVADVEVVTERSVAPVERAASRGHVLAHGGL